MKRSSAISRLVDVVDGLDRAAQWPETTLVAAFVFGALLDDEADLEHVRLALVVAEPAESVPWMAQPPHLEALAAVLGFTKLPLSWRWRPQEWPVWNHEIDRSVRFWTKDAGRDQGALDALSAGTFSDVTIEGAPSRDDLHAQLLIERDVGRRHLGRGDGIVLRPRLASRTPRRRHLSGGPPLASNCGIPRSR